MSPFIRGCDFAVEDFLVRPLMRLRLPAVAMPFADWRIGLLDLVLARLFKLSSEPEPSFSSWIGSGCGDFGLCFRAADRVTGAK